MSDTIQSRRLQVEIPPEAYERLNEIKNETQASSLAEVVRYALITYDTLMRRWNDGYEIELVKKDEPRRVVLEYPHLGRMVRSPKGKPLAQAGVSRK